MISMSYLCLNGHDSKLNSQPLINAMPAGNFVVSAAILFSRNTFANINGFSNFCGFPIISETKFYNIQKQNLWPIVNTTWLTYQKDAIKEAKRSNTIDICGDGRADSLGHNAKFGTYSVMDESSVWISKASIIIASSGNVSLINHTVHQGITLLSTFPRHLCINHVNCRYAANRNVLLKCYKTKN